MSCSIIKYIPLMIKQSIYNHNIFGYQKETINNSQTNRQNNKQNNSYESSINVSKSIYLPIIQQVLNDTEYKPKNNIDLFLEHIFIW